MAKVHKSLRLAEELDARVQAAKADGESDAAAYSRVIETGLAALEGQPGETTEPETAGKATDTQDADKAATAALEGRIADLKDQIETLKDQLDKKDGQISALNAIATNAQALHGAEDAIRAKQMLDNPGGGQIVAVTQAPRGRWARAWAVLTGRDERGA